MHQHEKINYVEFPAIDMEATKQFFTDAFGWAFTDFGEEYTAFSNEGLDGGFFKSDKASTTKNGSALIVFYSKHLEDTQRKVLESGGTIVQETFSFPGGKRFHFADPSGIEFAAWSDT